MTPRKKVKPYNYNFNPFSYYVPDNFCNITVFLCNQDSDGQSYFSIKIAK